MLLQEGGGINVVISGPILTEAGVEATGFNANASNGTIHNVIVIVILSVIKIMTSR